MKKQVHGILLGCTLMSSAAFADSGSDLQVSATAGFMSEYVWRGWNINDGVSGYGAFEVSEGGFYGGIWGGSDKAQGTEVDLYVGYGGEMGDSIGYDVGYIQYRYPDQDSHVSEWHLMMDFNFVSVTYHKGEDDYDYIELNKSFELGEQLSLELHYGREDSGSWNYNDYMLTLNYQINDNYRIYLAATDKEDHDSHVYAGIEASF